MIEKCQLLKFTSDRPQVVFGGDGGVAQLTSLYSTVHTPRILQVVRIRGLYFDLSRHHATTFDYTWLVLVIMYVASAITSSIVSMNLIRFSHSTTVPIDTD